MPSALGPQGLGLVALVHLLLASPFASGIPACVQPAEYSAAESLSEAPPLFV